MQNKSRRPKRKSLQAKARKERNARKLSGRVSLNRPRKSSGGMVARIGATASPSLSSPSELLDERPEGGHCGLVHITTMKKQPEWVRELLKDRPPRQFGLKGSECHHLDCIGGENGKASVETLRR